MMRKIAEGALKLLKKSEGEIRRRLTVPSDGGARIRPESMHKLGDALVLALPEERVLLIVADYSRKLPALFQGEVLALSDGGAALIAPFSRENCAALRRHFPWCAPVMPAEKRLVAELDLRQVWKTGLWIAPGWKDGFPVVERATGDEATFAAFAFDYRGLFGVWAEVSSVSEVDLLQREGVTLAVLRCAPDFDAAPGDGTEYAARTFVLEDGVGLTIPPASAAEIAGRYAETLASTLEFLRRTRCAAAVSFAGCGRRTTAAELLYLSREWMKDGVALWALEPEWGSEPDPETLRCVSAVARSYGNYRLGGGADVAAAVLSGAETNDEALFWLRGAVSKQGKL